MRDGDRHESSLAQADGTVYSSNGSLNFNSFVKGKTVRKRKTERIY
jgi:hypothetical protein